MKGVVTIGQDIYLNKQLVSDLKPNEVACYTAIRYVQTAQSKFVFVSPNMIEGYLTGNTDTLTRDQRKGISEGLKSLCEKLKLPIMKFSKSDYLVNCESLRVDTKKASLKTGCEFFVFFDSEYIQKIFAIDTKANKFKLLKYFIVLLGTVNNTKAEAKGKHKQSGEGKAGFMTNEHLAEKADVSPKTALDYNKLLEDAEVIFFYRSNFYNANIMKSLPNYYGLWEYSADITRLAKIRETEEEGKRSFKKGDANKRRSMKQKLNQMKQGRSYSPEETKELLEYKASIEAEASRNEGSSEGLDTSQGTELPPKAAEESASSAEGSGHSAEPREAQGYDSSVQVYDSSADDEETDIDALLGYLGSIAEDSADDEETKRELIELGLYSEDSVFNNEDFEPDYEQQEVNSSEDSQRNEDSAEDESKTDSVKAPESKESQDKLDDSKNPSNQISKEVSSLLSGMFGSAEDLEGLDLNKLAVMSEEERQSQIEMNRMYRGLSWDND